MPEKKELFCPQPGLNKDRHIYTVSQITQDIKLILENTFCEVWVEGEISNFRQYSSGHYYLSLKDKSALLQAVIFNRSAKEIKFKLEDGLKVICFGRVELYEPRGQYQLIIEKIEPKGIGSLQLALEQLKAKLEKEGLFAAEHKRPIPYLPGRIGVVTSLSGAAIKDILKVLDSRFRDIHITIYPVRVQGEEAKKEIAQAIEDFNRFNIDSAVNERIEVLIVGRGGGCIEDLWAFNEEIVARAIYNSRIPVISAVGHERDWTIADLVADVRAATPSVAAEMVIPKKEDLRDKVDGLFSDLKGAFLDMSSGLLDRIDDLARRLTLCAQHSMELNTRELASISKKLALLNPTALIQQHKLKIADLARQMGVRIGHFLKLRQAEFNGAIEKLESLSPLNILGRGYSITFKMPQGQVIKDVSLLKTGDTVKTRLHKGEILSKIMEVNKNGRDEI
ncbi:MAG: exodeoxyribonuclease VII large subunit [Candidatus Omnitrophica bacterium]|nr:exodeoxyribonuclease VII large subunit [Candidatus Omnitrophota bacterium]MDD5552498.1 exodeoxyribonuclease VII large subunit [Candidatus Omnitrophota bacterium]